MLSTIRARIPSAARWLAPSAIAACGGAIVAGALEGAGMDGALGIVASAGFVALIGVPILFVLGVVTRGLWVAWAPRELGLVEDGGGAPWLAGWIGVIILGGLALAWVMFQGTWVFAAWTAFKPLAMSFAEPVLAIGATLVLVIVSRPAARGIAAIVRAIDARWRRRGRRSLVTPLRIAVTVTTSLAVIAAVIWKLLVRPRLGPLELDVLAAPAIGIAVMAAIHFTWRWVPRHVIVGGVLGGIAAALIATALITWQTRPSLTIAIWGDRPIAGFAIDQLFDLDAVRAEVSLAEFLPVPTPGAAHPDIILITIDTVRADHTPPYGGSAEMPNLEALADQGVVFEWAFSPSNVTRRSIPSMIIGLAPNRVHGRVVGWALRVDPRHVLVAERLEAGGYDTTGFVCCEGFWGKDFHTGLQRGLQHLEIEPNGLALARRARAWLDAREQHPDGKPLFLWMHILEPHNWQAASGEPHNDDERRKFYDRSLAASDVMVGEVLGAFAQRPPGHGPIVIVTADHGEGLGDHGQPFHSTDLYDSQIHVPLVIAGPGIKPGRIAETVSSTDLAPTLVELAGFDPPHGIAIDGESIADLATGRRAPVATGGVAFAAMIKDRSNPGGITAIVKGRWKLIDDGGGFELYNLGKDPDERSNLISVRPVPVEARDLRQLLQQHQAAASKSPFE